MRLDGCLLVSVLLTIGCVQRPDPAQVDHAAVSASPLSSVEGAPTVGAICAEGFCDELNQCPSCDGQSGTCGSDGVCRYGGTGGDGGGGGPICGASLCMEVSDCLASCPRAITASCLDGTCVY